MRKSLWIWITCVLIGALFGSLLGEILTFVTPTGRIQNLFSQSVSLGLSPPVTIDLKLFTFTVGFTVRANLLTFIGAFLGVVLYKQI